MTAEGVCKNILKHVMQNILQNVMASVQAGTPLQDRNILYAVLHTPSAVTLILILQLNIIYLTAELRGVGGGQDPFCEP